MPTEVAQVGCSELIPLIIWELGLRVAKSRVCGDIWSLQPESSTHTVFPPSLERGLVSIARTVGMEKLVFSCAHEDVISILFC